METKVKGEAIKDGSVGLNALSKEVQDKINAGGRADWNAQEWEAGYIENRTHSAAFTRIEYNQENNKGKYEVAGFEDKLLLLWRKKYFTVHKNIPLTIDVNDGEDTFIVNYNGTTLYITDNNGYLYDEHEYISVSETNIPLAEAFIPETVIKTTPQKLSDTDKNQALANLGIDPVVLKYLANPHIIRYDNSSGTCYNAIPKELSDIIYQDGKFNHLVLSTVLIKIYDSAEGNYNFWRVERITSYNEFGNVTFTNEEFGYDSNTRLFVV